MKKINLIITEAMQSWKLDKEVDDVAKQILNKMNTVKSFNETYSINGTKIHVIYPLREAYTLTSFNGDIELGLDYNYRDINELKSTIFHELEHKFNSQLRLKAPNKSHTLKNGRTDSRVNGEYQKKSVNFQYENIEYDLNSEIDGLNNGDYRNTYGLEPNAKGYYSYNDIILEDVQEILYKLWNGDERDAHQESYIMYKNYFSELETSLDRIIKYTNKYINKNKNGAMRNFWKIIGNIIYENKKHDHYENAESYVIKIGGKKEQPKSAQFFFNYFVKKTRYLLAKTKKRYARNILKSPIEKQW